MDGDPALFVSRDAGTRSPLPAAADATASATGDDPESPPPTAASGVRLSVFVVRVLARMYYLDVRTHAGSFHFLSWAVPWARFARTGSLRGVEPA